VGAIKVLLSFYFYVHIIRWGDVTDGRVVGMRVHQPDADRYVVGVALVPDRNGAREVGQFATGAVVENVVLEIDRQSPVLLHSVGYVDADGVDVEVLALHQVLFDLSHFPHGARRRLRLVVEMQTAGMCHAPRACGSDAF
jgi:hypothetical protein